MPAAQRKESSKKKPVLVFFPIEVIEAMNAIVRDQDTDRSKFIRKAVRSALRSS